MSHKLSSKLAAYSLAAGAAVGLAANVQAFPVDPTVVVFEGPWFDDSPHFGAGPYDMIAFFLDGTVLVDDVEIDPAQPLGTSISFVHGIHYWGDNKDRDSMMAFANGSSGLMTQTVADAITDYETLNLGYGADIDGTKQFTAGETGMGGYGWYGVWGPWGFGGTGYVGFFMDDGPDRHYGWAHVTVGGSRNEITLHSFGIETTAGEGIKAGETPEPVTLSLLALGATGLLARRKK